MPKRDNSKRKIVAVPELLPERVELTKQSNEIEMEPMQIFLDSGGIEQEPTEVLESIEMVPQSTTSRHIEILEQSIIKSPLSNALSYTIPNTSVLVLTSDGNYVITKLEDDVSKTNEIQVSPPQVKEIIILNGNDLQLTNMGMGIDYQTIQYESEQTIVDDHNSRYKLKTFSTKIRGVRIPVQFNKFFVTFYQCTAKLK